MPLADEQFISLTNQLARLETHMESLIGNGQPGVISKLDERVRDLETETNRNLGRLTAVNTLLGAAISAAIHRFWR
jgi:hypothetical protein